MLKLADYPTTGLAPKRLMISLEEKSGPIGVMLSGGIDSSILLAHSVERGREVQPFDVRSGLVWQAAEMRGLERFLSSIRRDNLRRLVVLDLPLEDLYDGHWSTTGADTPDASTVVTFDPTIPGGFLVAVRDAAGDWTGKLDSMDAAHGYWVLTDTFTPIEVDVPPLAAGSAALPPTLPIAKGWNLVPVLDVAGTKVAGDTILATKYFVSLRTELAFDVTAIYFFDTVLNAWVFVDHSSTSPDTVEIGRAYWIFSLKAGTLVPVP